MEESKNTQSGKTELEYFVAPIWRRFVALVLDFFLIAFTAFALYGLSNMALAETPWFKDVAAERSSYQEASGLYENGYSLVEKLDQDTDASVREKKDILADCLETFYVNSEFCEDNAIIDYNERRKEARYGVVFLFSEVENGVYEENDVNPQYLYDFYVDDFNRYALGYLSSYGPYAETTRFYFWSSFVQIVSYLTLSLVVYWLVLPLTAFKRGRMTIGRKIMNVAILGANALTPTKGRYLLRFLFVYFVYFWIGFFSFLIPELVSVGMQMFSKRQQDLAEYVLNQYSVDSRNRDIYLDYGDYVTFKDRKGRASIFSKEIQDGNVGR